MMKIHLTNAKKCVKSHSTAQHSTAQHSTAQHSTALTTLLLFSDKELSSKSIIIDILRITAMQRSMKLLFCVAFFIFAAIEQSMKVSERDFVILENLSLFLYWRTDMNKRIRNLADVTKGQPVGYPKCLYESR